MDFNVNEAGGDVFVRASQNALLLIWASNIKEDVGSTSTWSGVALAAGSRSASAGNLSGSAPHHASLGCVCLLFSTTSHCMLFQLRLCPNRGVQNKIPERFGYSRGRRWEAAGELQCSTKTKPRLWFSTLHHLTESWFFSFLQINDLHQVLERLQSIQFPALRKKHGYLPAVSIGKPQILSPDFFKPLISDESKRWVCFQCDPGEQCALRKGSRIGKLCDCSLPRTCNSFLHRCFWFCTSNTCKKNNLNACNDIWWCNSWTYLFFY